MIRGAGAATTFTAERWIPSSDKGFEMLELPFTVTTAAGMPAEVTAFWTGTDVLVVMDEHQFMFNPSSNKVQILPLAPNVMGGQSSIAWTDDTLFWWGWDRATYKPGYAAPRLVSWRPEQGWADVPFPDAFLQATPILPACITALDGAVYVFDPQNPRNPSAGLDPNKPLLLRYEIGSKAWTALPQTMLPQVRCNHGIILFKPFPDGIAFIPEIYGGAGATKYPPVGEIWWKATGKWTAMSPPPIAGPLVRSEAHWTGSSFVITDVDYVDPVVSALPKLVDTDGPSWPVRYNPYTDQFQYMTSVGFPKPRRFSMASVWTGSEIFMLGGSNGYALTTLHNEGFRYRPAVP